MPGKGAVYGGTPAESQEVPVYLDQSVTDPFGAFVPVAVPSPPPQHPTPPQRLQQDYNTSSPAEAAPEWNLSKHHLDAWKQDRDDHSEHGEERYHHVSSASPLLQ